MTKTMEDKLAMPNGLCPKGVLAYNTIMETLRKNGAATAEIKAFYSPQGWRARGESYCWKSLLVVVYDGIGFAEFFSLDADMDNNYRHHNKMREALDAVGLYAEEGTNWYSGIYGD